MKKYRPPVVSSPAGSRPRPSPSRPRGFPPSSTCRRTVCWTSTWMRAPGTSSSRVWSAAGHIGRYSGFVLWENVIEVLLARIPRNHRGGRCAALFAGGISTALSGAMVSAIVAPLADRAVDVGVLVGTGYLFTREAVECGAINAGFQRAIVEARRDRHPGLRGRLPDPRRSEPVLRRLRGGEAAADRAGAAGGGGAHGAGAPHPGPPAHRRQGSALQRETAPGSDASPSPWRFRRRSSSGTACTWPGRPSCCTTRSTRSQDLHRRISEESRELLDAVPRTEGGRRVAPDEADTEIAIVGMSALFPGAADIDTYWENILAGKYSITEVPPDGGALGDLFRPRPEVAGTRSTPAGEGSSIPSSSTPSSTGCRRRPSAPSDPFQLLTLELVDRALRDAGYDQREFDREHTSVFVGEGGRWATSASSTALRSLLPMVMSDVPEQVIAQLPEWTEDSFPGLLPERHRRARGQPVRPRRHQPVHLRGLRRGAGRAVAGHGRAARRPEPMSIVAAVDVAQNPFIYLSFSKTMALSPTGTPRCFDAAGDGIVISQGVGCRHPQATGGRASGTATGSTPCCAAGQLQRRTRQEPDRTHFAGTAARPPPRLRPGRLRPRHGGAHRGARHRDRAGRPHGGGDASSRALREAGASAEELRRGHRQVDDRPHQGLRGDRGADQGGPGAAPQGAAAHALA